MANVHHQQTKHQDSLGSPSFTTRTTQAETWLFSSSRWDQLNSHNLTTSCLRLFFMSLLLLNIGWVLFHHTTYKTRMLKLALSLLWLLKEVVSQLRAHQHVCLNEELPYVIFLLEFFGVYSSFDSKHIIN